MRKTYEELDEIKKRLKVSRLWSWSRYNCYASDTYEYYLKYVKKAKEDRLNRYCNAGGSAHDILEDFYLGKIKYEEMIDICNADIIKMDLMDLKYDRSDDEKNKKIAIKYEDCMRHFFINHKKIEGKIELERFVTIRVGRHVLQGYIDLVYKEDDCFIVGDWKTSTLYSGAKILQECGQLVLYSLALMQLGIPLDKIKARWNFLKYVNVSCMQKKGTIKVRKIERNEIGNKLYSNAKTWLKHFKYDADEIDSYLSTMCLTNDISCLPEEVQEQFSFDDCWIDVPLTQELVDEWITKVNDTLLEIMKKEIDTTKCKTDDDKEEIWWQDVTDAESWFMACLSGYSANIHKPYKEYLESRDTFNATKTEDADTSWLDELD